jgi:hypothetical protein
MDAWLLLPIAALVLAALALAAWTLRTGISPMPTLPAARRALLGALPPPEALAGAVHERGAGWGTLALPLARRYPERSVVAWELSPLPWAVCRLRARLTGARNLAVRRADFLRADLRGAALLVCYLDPGNMARLRPKLEAELAAGAVLVSHTFAVPGWQPEAVVRAPDLHASPIYRYRWPDAARPGAGSVPD